MRGSIGCFCLIAILGLAACGREPARQTAQSGARQPVDKQLAAAASRPAAFEKLNAPHLPNAYRIHQRVISGGQPDGEAGFRELAELGVKTVVSVDGAKPLVDLARRHGLRYVHLPHGYDGISAERSRELSRAIRDLPAPIYIHCHHGKHRSPTAAAVACIGSGLIQPTAAVEILRTAGTSPNYRGLYHAAERAHRFADSELDNAAADFPETSKIPPLAEGMIAVEHTSDRLKSIAAAQWKSPPDHPDLDPPHEALLLREHFTELLRMPDVQQQPAEFQQLLKESEQFCETLEQALRNPGASETQLKDASAAWEQVLNRCGGCHRQFRDRPLDEKASGSRVGPSGEKAP